MSASMLTSAGFPPEGIIFPVTSFRLEVQPGEHPWQREHESAIAEHWRETVDANPHLFNGRMVFQRELSFAGGHIEGKAQMAPYSAFLHWRASGRGAGAHHLFAMPMIISSDGGLIAIRMARTTANPGRVYAPAGSLDEQDIVDGLCDLTGNMRRETLEETGLDLDDLVSEPGDFAIHILNSVAVFRIYRADMKADEISRLVDAHAAADPHGEIDGAVIIRDDAPSAHDYSPFMPPILNWLFTERSV